MSQGRDRNIDDRNERMLYAYHDGELTGLKRWRFERELRRSPELRGELETLSTLGEMLREQDAAEPSPDLWGAIALRLPAIDARRAEAAEAARPVWAAPSWWLKPVGAFAATVAVAMVVVYGGFWVEAPVPGGGVVRWIDSGERSVMVIDDDPETTIIWVLDGLAEGAWIGGRRDEV